MSFEAEWTGGYPSLCFGEWLLKWDGLPVILPEDRRESPMGTFGSYPSWHFEDWLEVFESYEDGLHEDEWREVNQEWVHGMFIRHNIPYTDANLHDLYEELNACDWRSGSCGGCI